MQLALFDFDHTITHTDTYSGFLRRVATPAQRSSAWRTLGPWLAAYRMGLVSAPSIRARVTHKVFGGRHLDEITAQGQPYANAVLPSLERPEMMQRIDWHQSQGHTVAVVSASLDLYLQPWCQARGLEWICNRLEHHDGLLTGRYADEDCGPHKARLIQARYDLHGFERIHAYGDSREDRPMLALAHERWFCGKRIP
ncbi:HAD family hydrolase [Pseudoxanthomonas sp.]|uniref:HAD family hydrolase n=1 Tax=Pseudoxanthomonas sp. TaxID=1871049 RepID=UPI00261BB546|nr:HAD family hydrolase [Pseudoxanthomonas sp.]WDS36436.1 MAG: HAD-IB family hydrolase [Pseudoxanthomonas sp.]